MYLGFPPELDEELVEEVSAEVSAEVSDEVTDEVLADVLEEVTKDELEDFLEDEEVAEPEDELSVIGFMGINGKIGMNLHVPRTNWNIPKHLSHTILSESHIMHPGNWHGMHTLSTGINGGMQCMTQT